ncbi:MAG: cation diffusion facilitator family transporter [Spongiibacteraceae bacterium]
MSGHHGHHHGHGTSRNTLVFALCITLCYAAVEALAGWWANSLALMGDAGHMATDSMALGVAAGAAWLATAPTSPRHSYGLQRAEVLGAMFNVLFMYAVVIGIAVSAVSRLQNPPDVEFRSMLVIGGIGLLINILVAWLLNRGEHTLNSRGALLHVMGDLLGSVAAIVAGLVVWRSGWMLIDPLLSLLICALILWSSTRLLLDTINVIMEAVPSDLQVDTVRAQLTAAHPDIIGVHHLHLWTISSGNRALSAHIEVAAGSSSSEILQALEHTAGTQFTINHGTYQLEYSPRCNSDSREGNEHVNTQRPE